MESLEEITAHAVAQEVAPLMDVPDPQVIAYRTDEDYAAAHPESSWSASWHRMAIARAAQEILGLAMTHPPGAEGGPPARTRFHPPRRADPDAGRGAHVRPGTRPGVLPGTGVRRGPVPWPLPPGGGG
jgi:hypothetical protein